MILILGLLRGFKIISNNPYFSDCKYDMQIQVEGSTYLLWPFKLCSSSKTLAPSLEGPCKNARLCPIHHPPQPRPTLSTSSSNICRWKPLYSESASPISARQGHIRQKWQTFGKVNVIWNHAMVIFEHRKTVWTNSTLSWNSNKNVAT